MWYKPINVWAIFVVYFDQRAGALDVVCFWNHFLILKQLFSSFSVIKTTFSVFFRKKNAEKHVIKGVYQVLGITLKRVHLNAGVPSFMHVFLCYFCAFPFFPRSTRLLVDIDTGLVWYLYPQCVTFLFFSILTTTAVILKFHTINFHQIFFSASAILQPHLSLFSQSLSFCLQFSSVP